MSINKMDCDFKYHQCNRLPDNVSITNLNDEGWEIYTREGNLQMNGGAVIACPYCGQVLGQELTSKETEISNVTIINGSNEPTIRPEVLRFATDMESILHINNYKVGWSGMDLYDLMDKIEEEYQELLQETDKNKIDRDKVVKEAVDVANICMMIVDNIKNGRI